MTLPIDPQQNITTISSLIKSVNKAIWIDDTDDPWNVTYRQNNEKLD